MAESRKIAMTDGKANLAIDLENVGYMQSMGWTTIVQGDYEAALAEAEAAKTKMVVGVPDLQVITDKTETIEGAPEDPEAPVVEAEPVNPEADALAKAAEAAKTPRKR